MVLDHFSTYSEKKSLGYRRQGGGGQGDRAVVGQVKELVVGVMVSSDGSKLRLSLWALRVQRRRRGQVSPCLPLSPPLHPLDRAERVGSEETEKKIKEKGTERVTERRKNTPQDEDG